MFRWLNGVLIAVLPVSQVQRPIVPAGGLTPDCVRGCLFVTCTAPSYRSAYSRIASGPVRVDRLLPHQLDGRDATRGTPSAGKDECWSKDQVAADEVD